MSVPDALTYPDIVRVATAKLNRLPVVADAEVIAAEFAALIRVIDSLNAGAYDRLDAVELVQLSEMKQRCRRNVELLRGECGR